MSVTIKNTENLGIKALANLLSNKDEVYAIKGKAIKNPPPIPKSTPNPLVKLAKTGTPTAPRIKYKTVEINASPGERKEQSIKSARVVIVKGGVYAGRANCAPKKRSTVPKAILVILAVLVIFLTSFKFYHTKNLLSTKNDIDFINMKS